MKVFGEQGTDCAAHQQISWTINLYDLTETMHKLESMSLKLRFVPIYYNISSSQHKLYEVMAEGIVQKPTNAHLELF